MEVFIDADACPVVRIAERVAKKYNLKVNLFCDTNHILKSDYSNIIIIGAGTDAVDIALINNCHKGDIVITQDYGVAALALGKGAFAIHQSGKIFTENNIDSLLMQRYVCKKQRMSSSKHHIKGPKKRTKEDDINFEINFEKLILKNIQ
jgi:uncharacterized protein YaiI (UPF0178 family)